MAKYYKGTELRIAINLKAVGFNMDDDDWELSVVSGSTHVDLTKDDCEKESSSDSSSSDSESSEEPTYEWFAVVDTQSLAVGKMRLVATVHVPDTLAADGIRNEIAVTPLGDLVNP